MTADFYKDLAADYDRMIPWAKRLKTERPWFESLFARHATRSVLDAACGSGHHLALFAAMGLEVEGADASAAMVELARETLARAGTSPENRVHHAAWSDLPLALPRTFDAVLCIGNSLPYVRDDERMRESVRGLWSRVAPGGFLIVQYKNFEKMIAARERFLPLTSSTDEARETVALRLYEYHPEHIEFLVVLLDKRDDGDWSMRHLATPLRPWRPEEVEAALREASEQRGAGLDSLSRHGSLGLDPFDPNRSGDVTLLARKTRA